MKVTVVGAGAVGAMLGGLIKQHDPSIDMQFICRGPHGEAMQRAGHVVLKGYWGSYTVPVRVSSDMADAAGSDYILLTVKSQVTEETITQLAPVLGNAVLVSVQNGINQPILSKYVSPERLFVGITATNTAIFEPGAVSLQRNGITVIGPVSPKTPPETTAAVLAMLQKCGLPIEASANILGVQYNKMLINLMGYASVLSSSNFITEGILYRPWRRSVAMPLLAEGLATLQLAGIHVERTANISDIFRFRRMMRLFDIPPIDVLVRFVLTKVVKSERLVYSLYQDLIRGRKTEIEFANGQIVRLAKSCGAEAPYNAMVVQMVHELEARGNGTFFTRDEVVSRFQGLRR